MATNRERRKAHEDRFAAYLEEVRTQARAEARREALEEAIRAAKEQKRIFSSEEYAVGQPLSSLSERFACDQIIAVIRALAADHAGK